MPDKTAAERDAENQLALKDAKLTLDRAQFIIDRLANAANNLISITARHAAELNQFIKVYCTELTNYCSQLQESSTDLNRQLLMTRNMELEQSVRFVERAFIEPRFGVESQVLEAADWMCVEGFRFFIQDDDKIPIGPLVAIDSSMTPAVWAPNADLPIPSLFQTQPSRIDRQEMLAYFPVICLPGQMARSPEYFPLLSHEVGHAVDYYLGITASILKEVQDTPLKKYWIAWMREIVADTVGLTLSGEAFIVALQRYLNILSPLVEISDSNAYPANKLRLALLGCLLKRFHSGDSAVKSLIPSDDQVREINTTAENLLKDFRKNVAPIVAKHIFKKKSDWNKERTTTDSIAVELLSGTDVTWPKAPFRLMPSVIAMAQRDSTSDKKFDTFTQFRALHGSVKPSEKPDWVVGKSSWDFKEELLPSLRPTMLGTDGKFKVPPLLLMTTHQKIAFVGATNWQLHKSLAQAFSARGGRPWEELHIFFATNKLLDQVEYDAETNSISDRNKSRKELWTELSDNKWAKEWSIYDFDGPPVFASYWDWESKGGRIHVSPALKGTIVGKCPASDHIWYHDTPTDHYQKYVTHLQFLLETDPVTQLTIGDFTA